MDAMPAKIELFRANVRREASRTGMRFQELAARAGIHSTYLSRVLHGKSEPTLSVCEKIAAALGTSLEALLAEPSSIIPPIVVSGLSDHKIAASEEI
jgi:transcriptional regulator with XRE-family HTH domain